MVVRTISLTSLPYRQKQINVYAMQTTHITDRNSSNQLTLVSSVYSSDNSICPVLLHDPLFLQS